MAWHVYDIRFEGFERLTGRGYHVARFAVTKDEGLATWPVRVRLKPSLRQALGQQARSYDDQDLAGGLGAAAILTLLRQGLESFEQDITLDPAHYPGQPGRPEILRDYRHVTLRVEATPAGEVVRPTGEITRA